MVPQIFDLAGKDILSSLRWKDIQIEGYELLIRTLQLFLEGDYVVGVEAVLSAVIQTLDFLRL
jgi:hypothetical protein